MFNSASAFTPIGQEKIKRFAKILIENLTYDETIAAFILVAQKILSSSNVVSELNDAIRSTQASLAAFLFKFMAYKFEDNADICKEFIKDRLPELAHSVIEGCWHGYIDDAKEKLKRTQITFDTIKNDILKNKLQLISTVDLKPLPQKKSITAPKDAITTQLQNIIDSFCTYLNQDDQLHWHFEMKNIDYFFQSNSGDIKILSFKLNLILDEIKDAIKSDNLQLEHSLDESIKSIHKKLGLKDSEYKENSITRYQHLEYYVACIEPLLNPNLPDKFFSQGTQQTLIKEINKIKEILALSDTKKTQMENKDSETSDNVDTETSDTFFTPGQLRNLWGF